MTLFSGKTTQSLKLKLLKSKLVIAGILENGFEATFRSKTNVLSIPKWHFSFFFLEFFYWRNWNHWQRKTKSWKLCKSKVGNRKHFRKSYWIYLNVMSVGKWRFSVSWKFLSDRFETVFWESKGEWSKLFQRCSKCAF